MQDQPSYNPYNQPQYVNPYVRVIRIIAICAVIAAGLYVIVSNLVPAIRLRLETGIVHVKTEAGANLTVTSANESEKANGTKTSIRLQPGEYHITASKDGRATSSIVTVTKKQTTELSLPLSAVAPSRTVAHFAAQDLSISGSTVYFLNTLRQQINTYQLGEADAHNYTSPFAIISQVKWIDSTHYYALDQDGTWQYVANGNATQASGNEDRHHPVIVTSLTTNRSGKAAFISEGHVFTKEGGNAPVKVLDGVSSGNEASLAPNGSILISTPQYAPNSQISASKLYKDGNTKNLPKELDGAANVHWAPDSSSVSFTTQKGIFVYSLASQKLQQVLAATPGNPLSVFWTSPTSLIYAQKNTIWQYEITGTLSTKVADFAGILNADNPFTLSSDGRIAFFGTSLDGDNKGATINAFAVGYGDLDEAGKKKSADELNSIKEQLIQHYENMDLLLAGMLREQIEALKYEFRQFAAKKADDSSSNVQVQKSTVKNGEYDYNNPRSKPNISFKVAVDGTVYNATGYYGGLYSAQLVIYSPTNGSVLFDSGMLSSKDLGLVQQTSGR